MDSLSKNESSALLLIEIPIYKLNLITVNVLYDKSLYTGTKNRKIKKEWSQCHVQDIIDLKGSLSVPHINIHANLCDL